MSCSHPLVGSRSQSAKFVEHEATAQAPASQRPVPLDGLHAFAHMPQCAALVLRFTSQPLVGLPSQSANPCMHTKPQAPALHTEAALARAGHALPQRPQCDKSLARLRSQPSVSPALQSAKPAVQVCTHAPALHDAAALA